VNVDLYVDLDLDVVVDLDVDVDVVVLLDAAMPVRRVQVRDSDYVYVSV
jgi:hypothetical protein